MATTRYNIFKAICVFVVCFYILRKVIDSDPTSIASCTCNPNICTVYDRIKNKMVSINVSKCYDELVIYSPEHIMNAHPYELVKTHVAICMAIAYTIVKLFETAYTIIFVPQNYEDQNRLIVNGD